MRTAKLGVLASLGIGVFVTNVQVSGWEIKRQPWGTSKQQWSESSEWSEQWKWTANQQLPAAPGSAWQFSQSNTVAPPLPAGSSSQGKWTWIPSPASGGFYWSYSSSSSLPSSSQGPGRAPGTPWQFSQYNTTPPPKPAGQSVGSWTWVSAPSGGYYWSFVPGSKQDLPAPPGTAWQFSLSNSVAPALPPGSPSGSWKWVSSPTGEGYYWSFIAGPKQNLPPAPGTPWIFSASSTTPPPLPAGVSGSGTWKWVSNPDGEGYYWSFISSGGKTPQQKIPEPPAGGSGWIFSMSSTTPPALPPGLSGSGSWKWISSSDGKGYLWSFIPSPGQKPGYELPPPPTGGCGWIFSASSVTPPPVPAGSSATGTWKWVSAPNGNGYYWSYIPSPKSPQEQLPPPQSGSTEWIFSPSKTTPPSLPQGISGTAGSWNWVSAPNGNGYYWSFTPSSPSSQQLPAPKPGSTGWVFSPSNTKPPTISGITGAGSWSCISSASGNGFYWSWTPDPSSQGGVPVNPGQQGQQGQLGQPGQQGQQGQPGQPGQPGQQGQQGQPGQPGQPGQQGQPGQPGQPGQQGATPGSPDHGTGGFPISSGGSFDQGGVPINPHQPSTGGFDPKLDVITEDHFGGSFDQTGKPVSGGDVSSTQPGAQGSGNVPVQGGGIPQGSGNVPIQGGDIPQGGPQPQTGDQGQVPTGPSGGSFDNTGRPVDTTGQQGTGAYPEYPSTGGQPSTQPGSQGQVPAKGPYFGQFPVDPSTGGQHQEVPFGGGFDQTGKPIDTTGGSPINPSTGSQPGTQQPDQGQVPGNGPFQGSFDPTGKPIDTTGGSPINPSTGSQPGTQPIDQGQVPGNGPFQGSFDPSGRPVDTTGGSPINPSTGSQPGTQPIDQGQVPGNGPFQGSFDPSGRPVDTTGGLPVNPSTGELPTHENPQTGGSGSYPSSGDAGVDRQPFGGSFDQTGRPVDTSNPIQGGGSTSGSHSSGGFPVQQPGTTGETPPFNPQTGGEGSVPTDTEEDVVKGPYGGLFDKTGRPIATGSQGNFKCPPRSRIELLDAPAVSEAVCPSSQDRRYTAEGGKDFYVLCCRQINAGRKELAVIPKIPSLQYCIHICAGFPGCRSVLYTARHGHNSNYPVQSCQLFDHGSYDVQTPSHNDAHDSAYLIEPPTGGNPPHLAVEPPISTPGVTPPDPPVQVGSPLAFIQLPPGMSEQCAQSVFAAIKCGTCADC